MFNVGEHDEIIEWAREDERRSLLSYLGVEEGSYLIESKEAGLKILGHIEKVSDSRVREALDRIERAFTGSYELNGRSATVNAMLEERVFNGRKEITAIRAELDAKKGKA